MTEHHHNMRIEELPHDPEVVVPEQVDDRHGEAIWVRFGGLVVLVPAMILALVTLADLGAGGGPNTVIPAILLIAAAIIFRHGREIDPDDRW